MKKYLLVIAVSFLLAGCKPGEEKATLLAKDSIAQNMKDPSSAQFRELHYVQHSENEDGVITASVCGETNGKNSYGAYAGFTPFYVTLTMKPKGMLSKGVTFSILGSDVYSGDRAPNDAYLKACSPN